MCSVAIALTRVLINFLGMVNDVQMASYTKSRIRHIQLSQDYHPGTPKIGCNGWEYIVSLGFGDGGHARNENIFLQLS